MVSLRSNLDASVNMDISKRPTDEELLKDGLFLTETELLRIYIKILRDIIKYLNKFKNMSVDDILWTDINDFQSVLIIGSLIGMGGQRRQVITKFRKNSIYWDESAEQYMAKLTLEKVIRRDNVKGVVMPPEIGYAIMQFIEKYRICLEPKVTTEALWVNRNGDPLKGNDITKRVKKYCSEIFGDEKHITPLTFRRVFISIVFKNGLLKPNQTIGDFIDDLSIYLNTSPSVMENHYNRTINNRKNVETMQVLHSTILQSPEADKLRKQVGKRKKVENSEVQNVSKRVKDIPASNIEVVVLSGKSADIIGLREHIKKRKEELVMLEERLKEMERRN